MPPIGTTNGPRVSGAMIESAMDDLTQDERRLILGALWRFRQTFDRDFDVDDVEDAIQEAETFERLDSVARKLGGDPSKDFYGAADY